MSAGGGRLTRTAAQEAVGHVGWRYLLGTLCLAVPASSLADAAQVAGRAVEAAGADADGHLRVDVRADRVELSVATRADGTLTVVDTALALRLSAALGRDPLAPTAVRRPVQMLELAVDTLDAARIRPFWKAVLAYEDDPAEEPAPDAALADPAGQGPSVWFQQLDEPRPQRNRIHLDLTVAHDEAPARVAAAVAAGGRVLDGSNPRRFWILADADGNEVCVCTWQDRDPVEPGDPVG